MKFKRTSLLTTFVVTMGLLLGASAAQAQPVVNVDDDTATSILYLEVGSTAYNVYFLKTSADDLYTSDFDFTDGTSARSAMLAINRALNTDQRATHAGPSKDAGVRGYNIGFGESDIGGGMINTDVQAAAYNSGGGGWIDTGVIGKDPSSVTIYADFEVAGDPPNSVLIGGTVSGLTGSNLVLQNNGADDLLIFQDGRFDFETPQIPESNYNVTVRTQPTDQEGDCFVENGSGKVPDTGVTDVVVTCGIEPPPPEAEVLRECPSGGIVAEVFSAIELTDPGQCVINGVVVLGRVIVQNPSYFALTNSYVAGNVRVIRSNKDLESSSAIITNNVIDGGNIVIRALHTANVGGNAVNNGNIRVIDSESDQGQIASVINNQINVGRFRINRNLSAVVIGNSTSDGDIICRGNAALNSFKNDAVNGRLICQ